MLIGSDRRPTGTSHRTDTLLIAVVWYKEGQVSLISIPRDLWINIPSVGMQRINTAYQSGESNGYPGGGYGLLKDTIFQNLGIRIDHVAMVEFDGFRRIVDTLGGIEIPVACAYTDWRLIDPSYDPNNENNWWLYTVGPGQVYMDGDLASGMPAHAQNLVTTTVGAGNKRSYEHYFKKPYKLIPSIKSLSYIMISPAL
ncbi:MAG: cell envelope-related transcriptional attenuator [Chloroflexi bacterium OLB14]|nr:MAG: cell envelope-related transcriptional attenuator [Chloroflexi bacterium OLB14]